VFCSKYALYADDLIIFITRQVDALTTEVAAAKAEKETQLQHQPQMPVQRLALTGPGGAFGNIPPAGGFGSASSYGSLFGAPAGGFGSIPPAGGFGAF
jgi:hypothetical protein